MHGSIKIPTRWLMLALMVSTNAFVTSMPMSALPVLFKEISEDLNLSLVQVGSVWGMVNLAGIFISLLAGVLADRFGTRRTLIVFCFLTALTGALRGLADSFGILVVTVLINGAVRLVVPVTVTKNIGLWFRDGRLGLAMGLVMMGMGLGLMLGPLVSASLLSPWLGGWRNVMFFLGGLSGVVALFWLLLAREAPAPIEAEGGSVSILQAFRELLRARPIWIMGTTLLFRTGCLMGVTGYVPLYLRDFLHWKPALADGTLSAFYAFSAAVVVPLTFLSDRIGSRRKILIPALVCGFLGTVLMPIADGALVWVLMIAHGMFLDTFMSLTATLILESKGVKPEYFGTAIGMIFTMGLVGAVSGPPLGALFTKFSGDAPFYFWAGLAFIALIVFLFIKVTHTTKMESESSQ
jgi:MFS family permease